MTYTYVGGGVCCKQALQVIGPVFTIIHPTCLLYTTFCRIAHTYIIGVLAAALPLTYYSSFLLYCIFCTYYYERKAAQILYVYETHYLYCSNIMHNGVVKKHCIYIIHTCSTCAIWFTKKQIVLLCNVLCSVLYSNAYNYSMYK